MKPTAQWRTLIGVLVLGGLMVVAVWLCPPEGRAGVAVPVIGGLSTLGLYLSAKSATQHIATAKTPGVAT